MRLERSRNSPEFLGSSAGKRSQYITGRASAFRNDFRWNESGREAACCAPAIFSKPLDEVSCKKQAVAFVKIPAIAGLAESAM